MSAESRAFCRKTNKTKRKRLTRRESMKSLTGKQRRGKRKETLDQGADDGEGGVGESPSFPAMDAGGPGEEGRRRERWIAAGKRSE